MNKKIINSIVIFLAIVVIGMLGQRLVGNVVNSSLEDEICDNIDNDNDNLIDENLVRCCGNEECLGLQVCDEGEWGECLTNNKSSCKDIFWVDEDNQEEIDKDNDGYPDAIDKCLDSTLPEGVPTDELRPNHYAQMDKDQFFETNEGSAKDIVIVDSNYSFIDAYGCTCEQILYCKPGKNNGEHKWGCSEGTMHVWTEQIGWSTDCQEDGKVVKKGDAKPIFENTDGEDLIDMFDRDNDNDGVPDNEDDMIDDSDKDGEGFGRPDWWEKKEK